MADAGDSKSPARKGVWVRLPPPAPQTPAERVPCGDSQYPCARKGVWVRLPPPAPLLAIGVGVVDEFDALLVEQHADRAEVGQ